MSTVARGIPQGLAGGATPPGVSEPPRSIQDFRVAHVLWGRCNPESANGVDKSVYFLSMHQARLGAQVAVFCVTEKEPLPIPGVDVRAFSPGSHPRLGFRLPIASKQLSRELRAWSPDVVHIHSLHIGPFVGLGRFLNRHDVRYVVTPHGALAPARLRQAGPLVNGYLRIVEHGYLQRAAFIHAVGSTDVVGAQAIGVNNRIVLVPNGIDLAGIPTESDRGLLRREHPELSGQRVFLFLGRLDPAQKGLDLLLDGLAQCAAEGVVLVLVGPDSEGGKSRLMRQVERLGLSDMVLWVEPAYGEKKRAYLADADVFVHTSRWEGSPISVMEALAAGRPVLLSCAADPDGAVAGAGAGIVVEANAEAIARGLRQLSAAPNSTLAEMGKRARRLAERFDWRAIAGELLEAYGE